MVSALGHPPQFRRISDSGNFMNNKKVRFEEGDNRDKDGCLMNLRGDVGNQGGGYETVERCTRTLY